MAWFRQILFEKHKMSIMKTNLPKSSVMKRIIPVFAIAVAMTACNTSPNSDTTQKAIQPATDTTGMAEFRTWKAQNELVNTSENTANQPQGQTKTIVKYVPVSSSARRSSSSSSGSGVSTSSGTATTSRKKGWSSAA